MSEAEGETRAAPVIDAEFPAPRRSLAAAVKPHLGLRNIVIALGGVTLLVFIGAVASPRIAWLFAALGALGGLIAFEMISRRSWEAATTVRLQQMNAAHERLSRENAKTRNELADLKKTLAEAGALARSYGRTPAASPQQAEQRMVKALAEQLARLGAPGTDPQELEAIAATPGAEDAAVGRQLNDKQVMQLVDAAVRHDRIDLFLQPIVGLPQRKIRFYEMFSRIRIRAGLYLPAARYIEVAYKQNLIAAVDNLLLLRGLQLIREAAEAGAAQAFFCNITSVTLNDPKFMADLVEFIAQHRALAPRLVFELSQQDLSAMGPEAIMVLQGLARLDCRFSMDTVTQLVFDYAQLEARHIRFVKVDAQVVLSELRDPAGRRRLARIKAELDQRGIDFIVTRIEAENELLELLDIDIDYGQGFLFGKPVHGELAFGGKPHGA